MGSTASLKKDLLQNSLAGNILLVGFVLAQIVFCFKKFKLLQDGSPFLLS